MYESIDIRLPSKAKGGSTYASRTRHSEKPIPNFEWRQTSLNYANNLMYESAGIFSLEMVMTVFNPKKE